jgi:hypothetical protein
MHVHMLVALDSILGTIVELVLAKQQDSHGQVSSESGGRCVVGETHNTAAASCVIASAVPGNRKCQWGQRPLPTPKKCISAWQAGAMVLSGCQSRASCCKCPNICVLCGMLPEHRHCPHPGAATQRPSVQCAEFLLLQVLLPPLLLLLLLRLSPVLQVAPPAWRHIPSPQLPPTHTRSRHAPCGHQV